MLVLACSHSFAEPAFQPPNEVRLATNGLHSSNLYLSLATLLKCFCYFIKNEKSPATSGIKEFWLISFLLLLIWSSDPGLTWFGPPSNTHIHSQSVSGFLCFIFISLRVWGKSRTFLLVPSCLRPHRTKRLWVKKWVRYKTGRDEWMDGWGVSPCEAFC